MEYALVAKILPQTFSKGCSASSGSLPKFIECLPLLLLYDMGMTVDAANNYQRENLMSAEDAEKFSVSIGALSELGYFLFRLWDQNRLSSPLKDLNACARAWFDSPSDDHYIRTITTYWRAFARAAKSGVSSYSKEIAKKVYMPEQISAVDKRMHS